VSDHAVLIPEIKDLKLFNRTLYLVHFDWYKICRCKYFCATFV